MNGSGCLPVAREIRMEKWNYFGETSQTFKARWAGHKSNMKNKNQAGTALSAKIWELKYAGRNYEIKNKDCQENTTIQDWGCSV